MTNIIVKLQVEGIHKWPDAPQIEPEVHWLSHPHRHIFHITCKKEVTHSDRDVEIILFKRKIIDYLYETYGQQSFPESHYQWCIFQSMSCEMIAEELLKKFGLSYCSVLEDDENGAECFEDPIPLVFKDRGGGELH